MSQRTVSLILIILGMVILIVSLFAHPLGLGSAPGFGWKQILGTVLGVIISLAGYLMSRRSSG